MAGEDSGEEKSLEASEHKINEAKDKGQFARSREVTTVATFAVVLIFFVLSRNYMLTHAERTVAFFLRFDDFLDLTPARLPELFWLVLSRLVPILLPLFACVLAVGVGAEVSQIGIRVLKDPFEPKWEKLDPVKGFQQKFSLKQLAEGIKAAIKTAIFIFIVYKTIDDSMPTIVQMTGNSPSQGMQIMMDIALKMGFRVCGALAFFAGFDFWFQRWQYYKGLRMSHQEMKEEVKQQQGDPMLKSRIRSIQMEIARKRMMQEVPAADFVLTNPTHYAVALKYDPANNAAPVVVAKGQNFLAFRIREIAEEAQVPIIENPPLARAIYKKTKIGHPIPPELFKAVAQIMASIWHLASRRGLSWAGARKAARAGV